MFGFGQPRGRSVSLDLHAFLGLLASVGSWHIPWRGGDGTMNTICATQPRILVADDQPDLIDALRLLLKREEIHVESAGSPEAALTAITAGSFDLLLMDLN